jgi:hypothetical protein
MVIIPDGCAREVMETVPSVMRFICMEMRSRRAPLFSVPQFRVLTFLNCRPGAPLRTLDGTVNCRALNSCSAIDRREKPYYCRLTSTRVPLTLAHFLFLSRAGQGECRFAIAESV